MLTVKNLSETRWECRIDAVKAIRYQIGEVYDALIEVSEESNDSKAVSEAQSLAHHIRNYSFLVMLVIWYDILVKVNTVSKVLQSPSMQIDVATGMIHELTKFLISYRQDGFMSAKINAKELAECLELESYTFQHKVSAPRRKRKQFSYETIDEPILDAEKKFEVEFFNKLVDQAISSLENRFTQLTEYANAFGFLYNIKHACDDSNNLQQKCKNLQKKLTHEGETDVDGMELYHEIEAISSLLPEGMSSLDVLTFIVKNQY